MSIRRVVSGHDLIARLADVFQLPKGVKRIEISADVDDAAEICIWTVVSDKQAGEVEETLTIYQLLEIGHGEPNEIEEVEKPKPTETRLGY